MTPLLDSAWRATAYCLRPRVILLSLLPLALAGGAAFGLGWLYWEGAVAAVRATLEQWSLVAAALAWLDAIGAGGLRMLVAPLIVLALALPVIVIAALLLVAWLMTPALVALVAARRFPALERKQCAAWWQTLLWSLWCSALALLALLLSLPLWLVPPLVLVLPPLIWGWLTYRVFSFDVLASFASRDERARLMSAQRSSLLAMGVICGFLGAAPALLWAMGAATLIFAPLLIVVSVWLYTLVFAFSALWFTHFLLAALERLRRSEAAAVDAGPPDATGLVLPPPPAWPALPPAPQLRAP